MAKSLDLKHDVAPVVEKLSHAKIVMLGESSHGTAEFYEWRRRISQTLISDHGFDFIAVEGDWPSCSALNRYIHDNESKSAEEALKHFRRWPTWMWANTEIVKLAEWMKSYKAGFYGLDVYSLFESIDEILKSLDRLDPELAAQARRNYSCFDLFERDEKAYVKSLHYSDGCEREVLSTLTALTKKRVEFDGAFFDAEQNARIVKNAEDYYHTMMRGNDDSWNVRDRHMMETLNLLLDHHGSGAKGIVWAHNTHIGDYRATSMLGEGQVNLGGLAREEWGEEKVALLGFSTFEGSVLASRSWGGRMEVMPVPEGVPESYEEKFHEICEKEGVEEFFIWLKDQRENSEFTRIRGHRAIGVVYNPIYERYGNYVPTSLAKRYDGFIFIDRTSALSPLFQRATRREIPETWPAGV
jgi:erythromycin esterase-like protein